MSTTTVTMTPEQAEKFRKGHDTDARLLAHMSQRALADMYRESLRQRGSVILLGAPVTRDELSTAILSLYYPRERLNEAIHVLHHKPGEPWSACNWCHPHGGGLCECGLREAS